ncbi:hypothetical protein TNCT_311651 [Trichonephila clavata]|uniref:Uncharacterized protein n=1 Tax=Trichonephila clavata TaxID=2740835 RepID=A0A8X6KUI2_TRICU|nr:hypothetical protein TNCT_311651 [Trichonephila clavata]
MCFSICGKGMNYHPRRFDLTETDFITFALLLNIPGLWSSFKVEHTLAFFLLLHFRKNRNSKMVIKEKQSFQGIVKGYQLLDNEDSVEGSQSQELITDIQHSKVSSFHFEKDE